jgi:hypothetical protein
VACGLQADDAVPWDVVPEVFAQAAFVVQVDVELAAAAQVVVPADGFVVAVAELVAVVVGAVVLAGAVFVQAFALQEIVVPVVAFEQAACLQVDFEDVPVPMPATN